MGSFLIEKLGFNESEIESVELKNFKDVTKTANIVPRENKDLFDAFILEFLHFIIMCECSLWLTTPEK